MQKLSHYINGEHVAGTSGRFADVMPPATGEVQTKVPLASVADIDAAKQRTANAQCFGGAKNHMVIIPDADLDKAADALVGAGFDAAGERCMALFGAVPVGKETADGLRDRLIPGIEALKIGPYTAGDDVDFGPVITAASQARINGLVESGVDQGAIWSWTMNTATAPCATMRIASMLGWLASTFQFRCPCSFTPLAAKRTAFGDLNQ